MKTQLLEDIGQSATLSLVPSGGVSHAGAHKAEQDTAQARAPMPAKPRSAFGVWRQKPDDEPLELATPQPDQQAPPLASPAAFDPVHEAAISPAEHTFVANATHSDPAPQGPVFDFTPHLPTTPAPDLVPREPGWFERSGKRYLLWGSCVLAGALVIQAGWRLYEESKAAAVLALVADELKPEPPVDKAVKRRAIGAKEFTLGPDGEVRVLPVAPASLPSAVPRAPAVPPLVLLAPERAVEPAAAAPLLKGLHQTVRVQVVPASKPVRAKAQRAPERQLAREPVMQAEKKPEPESAMSTTLKACKEHGYTAAQCVNRACSVTKYGFVCRGK